ncbi:phosphatase PAP2 family protein [Sutcliffiella cohnii]|uniref:phosphatase PAP2 family protein n=1 Tax=Sutcliffiella cohnii TaxID=33932 RepID=UPI002E1EDC0E|nr:phosphatase PAP2 family protein [Sutcliffiella cohnii]
MVQLGIFFGIILFVFCLLNYKTDWVMELDNQMFPILEPFQWLVWFDYLGRGAFITAGAIILIIFLLKKRRMFASITVFMTVGGALFLTEWIKAVVKRERPPFEHGQDGFSFISGHAMYAVIFYLLTCYMIVEVGGYKRHKYYIYAIGILLSILIGVSRVVEKAHYFTDFLGGFGLGLAITLLAIHYYKRTRMKQSPHTLS